MKEPLWKIGGFVTAAGTPVVQKWYWDELSIEDRDAIRDRMNHLVNLPKNLWKEPPFKWFGDIGEIRKNVSRGALRVYGYFQVETGTFVFLHGVIKKKTKDSEGIETARKRLKRLQIGEGDTHGFDLEERASRTNSTRKESQGATSGIEPLGRHSLPDTIN